MHFLLDVHIAYRVSHAIVELGHEATHVNSILDKWHTSDEGIRKYADSHNMILISKDADFRDSHFLFASPKQLLKVNLGNISNDQRIVAIKKAIRVISDHWSPIFLIEIDKTNYDFTFTLHLKNHRK